MRSFWGRVRPLWPAAAAGAAYVAIGLVGASFADTPGKPGWAVAVVLALLALFVVFSVLTLIRIVQVIGSVRRRAGWLTKSEQQQRAARQAFRDGRQRAIELKSHLLAGGSPSLLSTWDVMLAPDEALILDAPMTYSRFYGTAAVYSHVSGFAMGRPAWVLAAMAGQAMGNASRRNAAVAAASPMWREHQTSRTLVTDRRIMCRIGTGWLSFYYAGVSASYPSPEESTLVLEFHDTEPLSLHGSEGASLCVLAMASLYGRHALAQHPALESFRELEPAGQTAARPSTR